MKFRTLKYFIKESFRSLIKNRLMSIASIMTLAVCIFIIVLSYCITVNISYTLEKVESNIGVSAFIEDKLEYDKINILLRKIQEIPHITNIEYIPPEEALERMKEELGDDDGILDGYADDNPLSASFNITIDKAENQKVVVSELEKLKQYGLRKVNHALTLTDALINLDNAISIISITLIFILCIISIVLISNTIKLAVYIRKVEINIMKYVGATNGFIRWPFIIEGAVIGLIGSVLPIIVCILGYEPIVNKISSFPIIEQIIAFKPSNEIFYKIVPLVIIVGIIIGTFGSIFSIRKHLKV